MSRNLYFDMVLDKMADVHDKKNEDYADDDNPFSNFEGAAAGSGLSVDQVFLVLLNIKSERLRQITSGKVANFESLEDSILDMANYAAIWLAWRWSQEPDDPAPVVQLHQPGWFLAQTVDVDLDLADIIEQVQGDGLPLGGNATIQATHEHIYPEEEIPHGTVEERPTQRATVPAWKPDTEHGARLGRGPQQPEARRFA